MKARRPQDSADGDPEELSPPASTPAKAGYVGHISTYHKLAYGLPGFATSSLSFLISVYATDFFVSLGASLAFLSFFMALARSFDIVTDPLMAWCSDGTRTRFGRRRPYMLCACAFYAVLFALLFSPPAPPEDGSPNTKAAIWFGIFYTLFYFSDTVANVPYESLGPELSDSYEERSRIYFVAKLCNMAGMLVAAGGPALVAYLIRHNSLTPVHVDAHSLFSEASRGAADPVPPQFLDGAVCRMATECNSTTGEYCFMERHTQPGSIQQPHHSFNLFFETPLELIEQGYAVVVGTGGSAGGHLFNCTERAASVCNYEVTAASSPACVPFFRYSMSALDAERSAFTALAIGGESKCSLLLQLSTFSKAFYQSLPVPSPACQLIHCALQMVRT